MLEDWDPRHYSLHRLKAEEKGSVEQTKKWTGWEGRENNIARSQVNIFRKEADVNVSSAIEKFNKMKPENNLLSLATLRS